MRRGLDHFPPPLWGLKHAVGPLDSNLTPLLVENILEPGRPCARLRKRRGGSAKGSDAARNLLRSVGE
eukprot:3568494-Pyramimonas_sp.AAC.1